MFRLALPHAHSPFLPSFPPSRSFVRSFMFSFHRMHPAHTMHHRSLRRLKMKSIIKTLSSQIYGGG